VRKRIAIATVAVLLLGGAYAAGAVGPSVLSVSGRRLEALKAVTSPGAQTFELHGTDPTPIPGARIALNVRAGESAAFDIRFSNVEDTSFDLTGDIFVDGVAVAPTGLYFFGGNLPNSVERVTAPLSAGRHVVTVAVYGLSGTTSMRLAGWTLVAEQVRTKA